MIRQVVIYIYILVIIISVLCSFLLLGRTVVYAQYSESDYPDMDMNATPNPVGSGARAMGMGGAFISVADDATAASWNPGGLLQLKLPEISIAGSWFSGTIDYQTSHIDGSDLEDSSLNPKHVNYLSAVIPFMFMRRNMVFSLNYQHLYEFSKNNIYTWTDNREDLNTNVEYKAHKRQKGSLYTISPAMALEVTPSLFIGLAANFWPSNALDNGWENLNSSNGKGIVFGREYETHTELYECYDFSGFNTHIGFLFKSGFNTARKQKRRRSRYAEKVWKYQIGGVIKWWPCEADIRHEQRKISYERYPNNLEMSEYFEPSPHSRDLSLKMPLSYGLGFSCDFSDTFSLALDLYRTHWEQYLIKFPSGKELSPINKKTKDEANIKPTTQIRMGGEYLYQYSDHIIPIRMGFFYDPEPNTDVPDDFYGVSFGTGILYYERFSIDLVYQFRFGDKKDIEEMGEENISANVTQHYLYASVIYYFSYQ